jgi:hypothetical protein
MNRTQKAYPMRARTEARGGRTTSRLSLVTVLVTGVTAAVLGDCHSQAVRPSRARCATLPNNARICQESSQRSLRYSGPRHFVLQHQTGLSAEADICSSSGARFRVRLDSTSSRRQLGPASLINQRDTPGAAQDHLRFPITGGVAASRSREKNRHPGVARSRPGIERIDWRKPGLPLCMTIGFHQGRITPRATPRAGAHPGRRPSEGWCSLNTSGTTDRCVSEVGVGYNAESRLLNRRCRSGFFGASFTHHAVDHARHRHNRASQRREVEAERWILSHSHRAHRPPGQ